MKSSEYNEELKGDLLNKIDCMESLVVLRGDFFEHYVNEQLLAANPSSKLARTYQNLSVAIINSMASLVDCFFVYCALMLGAKLECIKNIQYRPFGVEALIKSKSLPSKDKGNLTISSYKHHLYAEFLSDYKVDLKACDGYTFWLAYMSDLIKNRLYSFKAFDKEAASFKVDENGNLKFDDKLEVYHECMQFLYCNPCNASGVSFTIFADLNNFIKHNSVSYAVLQTEEFENPYELRCYSFFEVRNHKDVYLGDGFLKDLLMTDFNRLKSLLQFKIEKIKIIESGEKITPLCAMERKWKIGHVISIDKVNGFISKDEQKLFFFVGGVFFVKTKTSILIDAHSGLHHVLGGLIEQIKRSVNILEGYSFE